MRPFSRPHTCPWVRPIVNGVALIKRLTLHAVRRESKRQQEVNSKVVAWNHLLLHGVLDMALEGDKVSEEAARAAVESAALERAQKRKRGEL
eukprot:2015517-Prymnesium_polylepis.1